jgi:hypothetical protein
MTSSMTGYYFVNISFFSMSTGKIYYQMTQCQLWSSLLLMCLFLSISALFTFAQIMYPVTVTASNTPNILYGPTHSSTPKHYTDDPSLFCYAGSASSLLQLYSIQENSWLPVSTFSDYLWSLQGLNFFNIADRNRGLTYFNNLMDDFVSPYDVLPFQLPEVPQQRRFQYSNAFVTIRSNPWPVIFQGINSALGLPLAPLNVTEMWAAYYYGNLTLAITSFASGDGVYDQLNFELLPPVTPPFPVVWVLFDPLLGCQLPAIKDRSSYASKRKLYQKVNCHSNMFNYNSELTLLQGFCKPYDTRRKYLPGNCTESVDLTTNGCCCVADNYECILPSALFPECYGMLNPDADNCCATVGLGYCPPGLAPTISYATCRSYFDSDSVSATPSVSHSASSTRTPTSSVTPTISVSSTKSFSATPTKSVTSSVSVSQSLTVSATSTRTVSASPTKSPSISLSPTNSPISKSPTASVSISRTPTVSNSRTPSNSASNSATASLSVGVIGRN